MTKIALSTEMQQRLDFAKACYLRGLCKFSEYARAKRIIYEEAIQDVEEAIKIQERGEYATNR